MDFLTGNLTSIGVKRWMCSSEIVLRRWRAYTLSKLHSRFWAFSRGKHHQVEVLQVLKALVLWPLTSEHKFGNVFHSCLFHCMQGQLWCAVWQWDAHKCVLSAARSLSWDGKDLIWHTRDQCNHIIPAPPLSKICLRPLYVGYVCWSMCQTIPTPPLRLSDFYVEWVCESESMC